MSQSLKAVAYETAESFHSGLQNDEVDQLSTDVLGETDPEEREAMYHRIQEILNDRVPIIPLWYEPIVYAWRDNVKNSIQTSLGTYIWRDLDIDWIQNHRSHRLG